ncbi:MAG TPA: lysophospholipid acyltransferase family protein [Chthoniobacterales bacterium]|nr:lysophospholipid acyltransferase family protein [Chthoniobacterales bacterium]
MSAQAAESPAQSVAPPAEGPAQSAHPLLRRFAVKGVLWRNYLDFAVANVPFYLQPILIWCWTMLFFFLASPARRAVVGNLAIVLPGSSVWINHVRAFRILLNFAWTIAEAASFKMTKAEFTYEIEGREQLEQLAATRGAIVLTAHMGSYDLGAALFAQKFNREIRMVRAPEPDRQTAEHLDTTMRRTGEGAVKIDYNTDGAMLAFDLLSALRRGEIVSIQGDRVIPGVASAAGRMFGHPVAVPSGPFSLALASQVPIYPLFIARAGFRRYRVIVREPITVARSSRARDEEISAAVQIWCSVLEAVVATHWAQWFAFAPPFVRDARA